VHLGYGTFRFRSVSKLVDITSNNFYKCTANFRTQICRKCLRIKLNGFRPVWKLVGITSKTFYKCTATFRTHCIKEYFSQRNHIFCLKRVLLLTYVFCRAAAPAHRIQVNIRLSEWALGIHVELRHVVKVDIYCLHVVLSNPKLNSSHCRFVIYLCLFSFLYICIYMIFLE
jgi:hypothetical protein